MSPRTALSAAVAVTMTVSASVAALFLTVDRGVEDQPTPEPVTEVVVQTADPATTNEIEVQSATNEMPAPRSTIYEVQYEYVQAEAPAITEYAGGYEEYEDEDEDEYEEYEEEYEEYEEEEEEYGEYEDEDND